MAEVAETVDDALGRLPTSASTDDVWDATIDFSARELAASAARRALEGGGGSVVAPSSLIVGGHRLRMGDPLTPVAADGIGHSVAQAQDAASIRTFLINGSPQTGVSQLGSDSMATYTAGLFQKVGIGIHSPVIGILWTPTTDSSNTSSDDHIYGLPGAAIWETRIGTNAGTVPYRLSQRWYSIPGVQDCLFLEVQVSPDWTHDRSQVFAQDLNLVVMMETAATRVEALEGYNSALDGMAMGGQGAGVGYPTYTFLRSLTHQSVHRKYVTGVDINYNFGTGTLGGNVDTWTTTDGQTYQVLMSFRAVPRVDQTAAVFRFVVGLGCSGPDARLATRSVPSLTCARAVQQHENNLLRYPALGGTSTADERKAWAYHVNTLHFNTRTPSDQWFDRDFMANVGEYAQLPINALTRWNGLWTQDTPMGLMGSVHVNPGLVRDTLTYMFDHRMNQSTGFLYFCSTTPGDTHVQHGQWLFARIARRHLEHTGDIVFAAALYPKLALLFNWWTVTAGAGYRHPNWPTVKLLTAPLDVELQEQSPVTMDGNYPSGDDWTTAMVYDFCVQMAEIAAVVGNPVDVAAWNGWASDFRAALNTYCWDSSLGWFQPTMTAASPNGGVAGDLGRFNQVMTYRAFTHLWAGVATPAQAAIMRAKIMDPAIFLGPYGVRTADARWAGYLPDHWVKGASRPYLDAAVSVGLRRYGYATDADTVLSHWMATQNDRGTTPEAINPDTGTGGYARHLLTGNQLMEAYLAKCDPDLLYIGIEEVTS